MLLWAPRALASRLGGATNATLVWGRHQHSLDDLNREMEESFGLRPGSLGAEEESIASTPASAGSGSGSTASERRAAQAASAINRELFEFFGVPHASEQQQQQQVEGPGPDLTASALAQHAAGKQPGGAAAATDAGVDARSGGGGEQPGLTHVDASGRAAMVDVSEKAATVRTAAAGVRVLLGVEVFGLVARNALAKGDVLTVAQLAGVMGAKHTAVLIPLCHNVPLSKVSVDLALDPARHAVDVRAAATCVGATGVEMEALTAAAVTALTVYDMCKAASKAIVITDLRLLSKSGGRSGDYSAADETGATPAPLWRQPQDGGVSGAEGSPDEHKLL